MMEVLRIAKVMRTLRVVTWSGLSSTWASATADTAAPRQLLAQPWGDGPALHTNTRPNPGPTGAPTPDPPHLAPV